MNNNNDHTNVEQIKDIISLERLVDLLKEGRELREEVEEQVDKMTANPFNDPEWMQ